MHAHLSVPLTVQDDHNCLLASIKSTFDDLPKKLRRKTGWYEGNEKELDELIAARNATNRKCACSKTAADHDNLRRTRKALKKAKVKSRNEWWLTQLSNVNASVLPGKRDSKHPGDTWRTTARMSKGSTRWRERAFKNVRDIHKWPAGEKPRGKRYLSLRLFPIRLLPHSQPPRKRHHPSNAPATPTS
jgi:hypothetical protein